MPHQPSPDHSGSWRAMEEAVDAGTLHSIGVSNVTIPQIEQFLARTRVAPAV